MPSPRPCDARRHDRASPTHRRRRLPDRRRRDPRHDRRLVAREPTIGFLVGIGIGVVIAIAIWLRGR
ncbi:hypothetical protein AB5I41_11760 [Sphingomonas sp. MMS24-JH45]